MRFKEFRIIKESGEGKVFVIGDSIANGIASAGNVSTQYTNPGKNTGFILQNLIAPFVKSGQAKGATVILSSGAANSGNVSTEDGKQIQTENLGPVGQQIKMLVDAGAKVMLVGVASGKTPPQKPTQYTNGQKWTIDYSGMNDKLASIASSNGAKFLGPLEDFDPNIGKRDGIHPYNGYGKLFKEGSAGAGITLGPAGSKPGAPSAKDKGTDIDAAPGDKNNPYFDEKVLELQKALKKQGADLGSYGPNKDGLDGVMGPKTRQAAAKFPEVTAKYKEVLDKPNAGRVEVNLATIQDPDFNGKLEKMAGELGVKKEDLITIMKFESRLDPKARNPYSGATGLIQFMPSTARELGTSTEELSKMSAVEQLDYVFMYFKQKGIKPGMSLGDLYLAVFYPAAVGKSDNMVLGQQGASGFSGKVYDQNKVLDKNKDGIITVADVKSSIERFA